jgi:hypothetical protein
MSSSRGELLLFIMERLPLSGPAGPPGCGTRATLCASDRFYVIYKTFHVSPRFFQPFTRILTIIIKQANNYHTHFIQPLIIRFKQYNPLYFKTKLMPSNHEKELLGNKPLINKLLAGGKE